MKKSFKLLTVSAIIISMILGFVRTPVSAAFNSVGKHWYYSDEQSFKYWGITPTNNQGIPVDKSIMNNISFDGATPANQFKLGKEDYNVTAYYNESQININAKIGLRGDVVSDGKLDLQDVVCIARFIINDYTFDSSFHEFIGDYNGDGEVRLIDAVEISQEILKNVINDQNIESDNKNKEINEVLKLVNKERTAAGLKSLTLDNSVCKAAQKRAVEISTKNNFSHTRPDGRSCETVLDDMKISYSHWGENLAVGQTTPKEVVDAWMNSEGHRKNILNPNFTKIGIGYYYNSSTQYKYHWSQMFIKN